MPQSVLLITDTRRPIEALADLFERQHGDDGLPASFFELDPHPHDEPDDQGAWRFSLYCETVDAPRWRNVLEQLVVQCGLTAAVDVEPLDDRDWIAETLAELVPVRAGRFVVHGSHDRDTVRGGEVSVEIDAGLAFGTGHHGTTAGCLDAIDAILKRKKPASAIDVGCGSAVLAIAVAKAVRVPVLATDIDPVAVRVARANTRVNGVAGLVHCETSAGFQHEAYARFGPADIVIANILARPLQALARPLARHVASGGFVVLSGLLPHQQARIVATYRLHGLHLVRADTRDGWLTITMRKP